MDQRQLFDLFSRASQSAARGDLAASAEDYETCLRAIQGDSILALPSEEWSRFVRSAAINLAQVLNRLKKFKEALHTIALASAESPTAAGRARLLAAEAEALLGLGRIEDGKKAFEKAVLAHPVVGALNSADSMTRVTSTDLLSHATDLVGSMLDHFGVQLSGEYRAEAYTIYGKIAVQRASLEEATKWFNKALSEYPECNEARQQLSRVQRNDPLGNKREPRQS